MTAKVTGRGDLTVNTCNVTELMHISAAGSGDVTVRGAAEKVKVTIAGSGDVRLQALTVPPGGIEASTSGSGKMHEPRGYVSGRAARGGIAVLGDGEDDVCSIL